MKKIFLPFLLFLLVLTGCTNYHDHQGHGDHDHYDAEVSSTPVAKSEPIEIVTSFYPLAFLAEQITGENANVTNLAGSQDPHSYQMSPKDRVKISKADLVLYHGIGMETWAEDVIPELQEKNISVLKTSHGLDLLESQEKHDDHLAHKDEHDDHHEEHHDDHKDEHDEEKHDNHKEEGHDDHNHGEFDPHTWLDPILAQEMVKNITANLVEVDPKNSEEYQKKSEELVTKLQNLDAQYVEALSKCDNKSAIISHNAFGYLENRYNFELHPIAGLAPSDEPSAKLLAKLKEEAEHNKITHVLTEQNSTQKFTTALSSEANLQTVPINPMGSTPEGGDYFATAQKNIDSLKAAFGCE